MNVQELQMDEELFRVLLICHECWQSLQGEPKMFCYAWIIDQFEEKFGHRFHQAQLYQLTKRGFLKQEYSVRAGRYYTLADPERVRRVLAE